MTWYQASPRYNELLLPILKEFDAGRCAVIYGDTGVASCLPSVVPRVGVEEMAPRNIADWRTECYRCWPEWKRRLKDVRRRFDLPAGAFELLSHSLLIASQRVAGSLEFLHQNRPSVIITEYDRNPLWCCLVLAARRLQIPTVTLVHGAMPQDAITFSPVLADQILCWGELDRAKLLAAGEPLEKVVVAGCPRLSRGLSVSATEGRRRLALDPQKPVVMLGASPGHQRLELAESFCRAVETLDSVSGVVRLHASENMDNYQSVAECHPRVRFTMNSDATLDESLAAADIVVVCVSGLGSDALVKRRLAVVLNPEDALSGHDWDLVERAGCPHARTPGELADVLRRMLSDKSFREQCAKTAEEYVSYLCSAFGQESARRIAGIVEETAKRSGGRAGEAA